MRRFLAAGAVALAATLSMTGVAFATPSYLLRVEAPGATVDPGTYYALPDQIAALSRLPAREVLHQQLVAMVASPITGLVRGLNALIAGLAIQLQQIAEQGLVGGDAEAPAVAEAAAPAEEAAPEEGTAAEEEAAPEEEAAAAEEAEAAPEAEAAADEATPTEETDAPSEGDDDQEKEG